MKYTPEIYAEAFATLAMEKLSDDEKRRLVKNFIAIIRTHRNEAQFKKILIATEKKLREKHGFRKVHIETARPQKKSPRMFLKDFLKSTDIIEETINPDLIAGIKITVDNSLRLDNSLERKLQKLFM